MKKLTLRTLTITIALISLILTKVNIAVYAQGVPFTISPGLFNLSNQIDLDLTMADGTETVSVFEPADSTDHYSNGVVMTAFKGYLYCQWQSSASDEDAQDTWVAYSRSQNGKDWTPPMELAASIDTGFCSSGGWWIAGDTLVAYINVWPSNVSPRGGFAYYKTSTDGLIWSQMKPLLMANGDSLKGIFEQDPHALPDGRIVGAAHFQPGLIASPIYTDDPSGVRGWVRADYTNLSISGGLSREIEPSWFLRDDDTLVMTFRDQNNTFFRLASVSGDRGASWSTAVLTNMPDSRAKQSAGNIGDSTAYMVGNPANSSTRIPLTVTLSKDGKYFNTAYILRTGGEGIQPLRYSGQSKRLGYHYPKTIVYEDTLYVSYATNKEDVQYTRVPVNNLVINEIASIQPEISYEGKREIEILTDADRIIKINLIDYHKEGTVRIFNIQGQILYQVKMTNGEASYDMKQLPDGIYIIDIRTGSERETFRFSNW